MYHVDYVPCTMYMTGMCYIFGRGKRLPHASDMNPRSTCGRVLDVGVALDAMSTSICTLTFNFGHSSGSKECTLVF